MKTATFRTGAGLVGLIGLTLMGLGTFGGCSSGEQDPANHPAPPTGDGHKGHDHESESHEAKPAPVSGEVEMKSIQPSTSYPLTTCVVSGDPLTEMGGPIAFEYDGTEVQFCCKGCIKDFKKDPAAYMQKVRAAKK